MGTTAPRTRLVRRSPVHRHGSRALLTAAVGRRDQALEKSHHHCPLLLVGRLDCDVCWMGMEEGREGAVAVDHVRAPNTGWRGARVGGCPLSSASHTWFANENLPVLQWYGTVGWDGALLVLLAGYMSQ